MDISSPSDEQSGIIRKASYSKAMAQTGAVMRIQRFGSTLNLKNESKRHPACHARVARNREIGEKMSRDLYQQSRTFCQALASP